MMKSLQGLAFAVTVALFVTQPGTAKATLIGDEVNLEIFSNGRSLYGLLTETAGDGVEFNLPNTYAIDVGVSSIEIVAIHRPIQYGQKVDFVFTDLDRDGEAGVIMDVLLDLVQGIGSISFTEDSVTFSVLVGARVNSGLLASIELDPRQASVPEPGTLALLGLGLVGLGVARRRSQRTA